MQQEESATSTRHLLNQDSCFAHIDSFRRMKRTPFRPGLRRQNAGQKVYTRTRIYLSFPLLEDPLSVPFFLKQYQYATTLVAEGKRKKLIDQ